MRLIHRYVIDHTTSHRGNVFFIEMPAGAQILSIQTKGGLQGHPSIWAIVDPDAPMQKRRIYLYGTGHELPEDDDEMRALRYIGTFQTEGEDGWLVFHAFEGMVPVS